MSSSSSLSVASMDPSAMSQLEKQIHVRLFSGVTNADEVYRMVSLASEQAAGADNSSSSSLSYSGGVVVVDLANALSSFHLQYAALRALINESRGKLKTKQNIETELKYYLSGSNKISECVRQFTPVQNSTQIGLIVCHEGDMGLFDSITRAVQGTEISDEEFQSAAYLTESKIESIKTSFKIAPSESGSIESIIISKIAVKDI